MAQTRSWQAKITFYGFPDNDDGHGHFHTNVIAHALTWRGRPRHQNAAGDPIASGSGTFEDPITAAARAGNRNLSPGTLIYVPHLQKYFLLEDDCASCTNDAWVDLWMESNATSPDAAVKHCEAAWTGDDQVKHALVIHPAADLVVDTTPFFDVQAKRCNPPPGS